MNILEFLNSTFLNQNSSSETVESFLRNASFSTLFISMMFYWIQTAFSSRKKIQSEPLSLLPSPSLAFFPPLGGGKKQVGGQGKGFVDVPPSPSKNPKGMQEPLFQPISNSEFLILSNAAYATSPSPSPVGGQGTWDPSRVNTEIQKPKTVVSQKKLTSFGTITMILSNLLLICLLIFRWKESGHFPLSNLYESLMFLSWSCTCIHLLLDQLVQTSVVRLDATLLTKLIGSITAPSAFFTNAFATFSLPSEMQKASPLVPALQSNWLMMHVTVMIISYSALILGSLLSIAFLILISANPSNSTSSSNSSAKNDLAWNFDNLSYRVLGIGFPFLTIGILSGAVWANEAWGSYWSWDPKETWALLTWLIFAIYLHARITKGWQGKKPAIIASFGFLAIWVCFLGVNLIGEGLHSYGWFST